MVVSEKKTHQKKNLFLEIKGQKIDRKSGEKKGADVLAGCSTGGCVWPAQS